jgi:hypothetical protein
MPTVRDALDLDRYHEITRQADLGVNLWASLKLAAERGDDAVIKLNCQQIQAVTKSAFAVVKSLGREEPDHGAT